MGALVRLKRSRQAHEAQIALGCHSALDWQQIRSETSGNVGSPPEMGDSKGIESLCIKFLGEIKPEIILSKLTRKWSAVQHLSEHVTISKYLST